MTYGDEPNLYIHLFRHKIRQSLSNIQILEISYKWITVPSQTSIYVQKNDIIVKTFTQRSIPVTRPLAVIIQATLFSLVIGYFFPTTQNYIRRTNHVGTINERK